LGLLVILLLVLTGIPSAISQTTAYSVNDVEKLAKGGIEEHAFLESVKQHGIAFVPTVALIEELKGNRVPNSVLNEIWTYIPQGQSPEFYFSEGDRLLATGYYADAITCYQKVLLQLPDDPAAKTRVEQAKERQQKAEAEAKLRAGQDKEKPNLPYYRQQLSAFLQVPDCKGAFYYTHKIFFVGEDQSAKAAFEKACGPYSNTLEDGAPITLAFQNDLCGSSSQAGDKVDLTIVDPILRNGLLVVPQGAAAWGTVTKSEGGRKLARRGNLQISIEGMLLADGEKCPLATEETYRGAKKSKSKKTWYVVGSVLTAGAGIPLVANARGNDVCIKAGTNVTVRVAEKMSLDPGRFELSGPAPTAPPIGLPSSLVSVISLQNQGGDGVPPTSQLPASRFDVEQVAKVSSAESVLSADLRDSI
jgi:hypothetical protein